MVRRLWPLLLALFLSFSIIGSALAEVVYLSVDGDVSTPFAMSKADFDALPRAALKISKPGEDALYEGVDLAVLLRKAGVPLQDSLKGADTAKYLHAEGSDGFAAVVSLPELDDAQFLVADKLDGSPLGPSAGPLRLITSNEKRHSRWVKHLVLLRIKKSEK